MRLSAIFTPLLVVTAVCARIMSKQELRQRQLEATTLKQTTWEIEPEKAGDTKHHFVQNITFTNPKASGE
jgi:hypothetical protein